MKLLLDTQVALWWLLGNPRLKPSTRQLMATSPCVVSVASIWEVAIKYRLGKLPVAPQTFRDQMLAAGAIILLINDSHAMETVSLPAVHEDPFDRLLIAQARVEGICAVSADAVWRAYGIALVEA